MIRIKPVYSKPHKTAPKKRTKIYDEENIRPVGFNTKGYFDPLVPCNDEYIRAKQEVFEKYRNKKEEIIMLDPKSINKAAFIQRGLLTPLKSNNANDHDDRHNSAEPTSHGLLKSYLLRKQKKELQEHERFLDVPKFNCDTLTLRTTPLTARTLTSRQISSRISTQSVLKMDPEM